MSLLTILFNAVPRPAVSVHNLLNLVPSWLQGPVATDVLGAAGRELDSAYDNDVSDELFIVTADSTIDRWEKDYGIPTVAGDSLADRRARVLARKRAQAIRNDADFIAFVEDQILPVELAQVDPVVEMAKYAIYKPTDRGQVTNNVDVDLALEGVAPAHMFFGLAPWDDVDGLPSEYAQTIRPVAVNLLTPTEVSGSSYDPTPYP